MKRLISLIPFVSLCMLTTTLTAQEKPGVVKTFEAKKDSKAVPATKVVKEKPKKAPPSKFVKLELRTKPSVRASVRYGRKRLGFTPLKTKLKRNSGPVDIVIRAEGFITTNTRIFTNADTKLTVILTREEDANTLYGYKEKIPPDAGITGPDAGVTPATTATPATPTPSKTVPVAPKTTTPIPPKTP